MQTHNIHGLHHYIQCSGVIQLLVIKTSSTMCSRAMTQNFNNAQPNSLTLWQTNMSDTTEASNSTPLIYILSSFTFNNQTFGS